MATGELDKAIDAYQLGIRNYPRHWGFHNNLSTIYIDLGRYEEGLKEGLEAARLQPNVEPPYRRQLDAYICLDRLPEAKQLAEKLRAQGLDGARIHQRFLEMAYVEDDQAAIAREIQWFAGKPEEYLSFGLQAANRNVHGQRRESHKLYQRAAETALRRGLRNAASEFEEADARADALSGNCQTVRRLGRPALALAMCGDAAQAEKLAAETSKLFPNGTIWNAVQLPEIRAAIALNRDQPAKSVELLASASPYERAYLDAVYLRGLAYLRLHKGAEAAAEFRKIVDHKGANWGSCLALPLLGTVLFALLSGDGARLRARGRHGESQKGVPGLLRIVEGRRPRPPDSSASQSGIRRAAVREPDDELLREVFWAALARDHIMSFPRNSRRPRLGQLLKAVARSIHAWSRDHGHRENYPLGRTRRDLVPASAAQVLLEEARGISIARFASSNARIWPISP